MRLRTFLKRLAPVVDCLLLPLLAPAALVMKFVRSAGVQRLPACRFLLRRLGVFPIINHYYEPQFIFSASEPAERRLAGINWDLEDQVSFLESLGFAHELAELPQEETGQGEFFLKNYFFEAGDAEFWYQLIRKIKPKRIIEVGSGYSTLLAIKAIRRNQAESRDYSCRHVCIEPYERPWLETAGVEVVRDLVEHVDLSVFSELQANDILFIDSSHVIRSPGDVLFEYLEVLPTLNPGVIVHLHDIFSPGDYPSYWRKDRVRFWNEQYLLEAFLSHNRDWQILAALNLLRHREFEKLQAVAPYLTESSEPASFYVQRIF